MSADLVGAPAEVIGVARLARMAFEGIPLEPLFERLKARAEAAPDDAGRISFDEA